MPQARPRRLCMPSPMRVLLCASLSTRPFLLLPRALTRPFFLWPPARAPGHSHSSSPPSSSPSSSAPPSSPARPHSAPRPSRSRPGRTSFTRTRASTRSPSSHSLRSGRAVVCLTMTSPTPCTSCLLVRGPPWLLPFSRCPTNNRPAECYNWRLSFRLCLRRHDVRMRLSMGQGLALSS